MRDKQRPQWEWGFLTALAALVIGCVIWWSSPAFSDEEKIEFESAGENMPAEILTFSSFEPTSFVFFDNVIVIHKDGRFVYMGEEIKGAPEVYEKFQDMLNGNCK